MIFNNINNNPGVQTYSVNITSSTNNVSLRQLLLQNFPDGNYLKKKCNVVLTINNNVSIRSLSYLEPALRIDAPLLIGSSIKIIVNAGSITGRGGPGGGGGSAGETATIIPGEAVGYPGLPGGTAILFSTSIIPLEIILQLNSFSLVGGGQGGSGGQGACWRFTRNVGGINYFTYPPGASGASGVDGGGTIGNMGLTGIGECNTRSEPRIAGGPAGAAGLAVAAEEFSRRFDYSKFKIIRSPDSNVLGEIQVRSN